jgi:hypothetical protein
VAYSLSEECTIKQGNQTPTSGPDGRLTALSLPKQAVQVNRLDRAGKFGLRTTADAREPRVTALSPHSSTELAEDILPKLIARDCSRHQRCERIPQKGLGVVSGTNQGKRLDRMREYVSSRRL